MEIRWDQSTAISRLHGSLQMRPGFGFSDSRRAQDKQTVSTSGGNLTLCGLAVAIATIA